MRFAEIFKTELFSKYGQKAGCYINEIYDITLANYCVGERKNKIDMLIAIEETFAYKKAEILIVDDNWETLVEAANYGFQACTPMEIVNYVNNMESFEKE